MNSEKTKIQSWLDHLQEESWQLELLISGFSIFGLFELSGYLGDQMNELKGNLQGGNLIDGLVYPIFIMAKMATVILTVNLIIHVLVRGLWIGALGLRYVSGDIDYEGLNYSPRFIRFFKRRVGSFDDYIIKLEKIASIIFSYSFVLIFTFISTMLFVIEMIFAGNLITYLEDQFPWAHTPLVIFPFFVIFLFLLVAIDFVTLGRLKRVKQRHFARFYFIVYRLIGFVMFSFLWRPLLLNFLDKKFTKRLFLFIVPYFLVFAFSQAGYYAEYGLFPASSLGNQDNSQIRAASKYTFAERYYDTMVADKQFRTIRSFSIPSYKLSGHVFEVFIKYDDEMEQYVLSQDSTIFLMHTVGYNNRMFGAEMYELPESAQYEDDLETIIDSLKKTIVDKKTRYAAISSARVNSLKAKAKWEGKLLDANFAKVMLQLENSIQLSVDDLAINKEAVSMAFYTHPRSGEKGLLCFFPIDLSVGKHHFGYRKLSYDKKQNQVDTTDYAIPFIYTGQ